MNRLVRLAAVAGIVSAGMVHGAEAAKRGTFDAASLPEDCQATLNEFIAQKPQVDGLTRSMQQSRKTKNMMNFCGAARTMVLLIKAQNEKLQACAGQLASTQGVTQAAADQVLQLRSIYSQMLQAAKDPKNDQMKCGLADQ